MTDVRQNIRPGFSEKINDPAIRAAIKKNGKATLIFAVIIILAPIIVTFIIGVKNDDMSVVGGGAVISIIFLVINLISGAKKKGEKQWDGVVIDKCVEKRKRHTPEEDRGIQTSTVYKTTFRTENGKTKILEETEINNVYFNYLNVGDKVRYYPQFNCYYEKFDKSRDTYAICPICATKNDISKDTCSRCGVPIIK